VDISLLMMRGIDYSYSRPALLLRPIVGGLVEPSGRVRN